jgi:hypothetical protein
MGKIKKKKETGKNLEYWKKKHSKYCYSLHISINNLTTVAQLETGHWTAHRNLGRHTAARWPFTNDIHYVSVLDPSLLFLIVHTITSIARC